MPYYVDVKGIKYSETDVRFSLANILGYPYKKERIHIDQLTCNTKLKLDNEDRIFFPCAISHIIAFRIHDTYRPRIALYKHTLPFFSKVTFSIFKKGKLVVEPHSEFENFTLYNYYPVERFINLLALEEANYVIY